RHLFNFQLARRSGQGRRRTTTAQRDRFLLLQSLRHRTLTAPALQVMTLGRYQFCLDHSDRRVRVNRCSGERY
ncbi:unnamed protein product, partial [Tenebrio molitor]